MREKVPLGPFSHAFRAALKMEWKLEEEVEEYGRRWEETLSERCDAEGTSVFALGNRDCLVSCGGESIMNDSYAH